MPNSELLMAADANLVEMPSRKPVTADGWSGDGKPKRLFRATFDTENPSICQDRLGTRIEMSAQNDVFLQFATLYLERSMAAASPCET